MLNSIHFVCEQKVHCSAAQSLHLRGWTTADHFNRIKEEAGDTLSEALENRSDQAPLKLTNTKLWIGQPTAFSGSSRRLTASANELLTFRFKASKETSPS